MKFKILAFALSLILLLVLLAGCTPKTEETEASYTLPGVDTEADKLPENESDQAAPSQTDKEPNQTVPPQTDKDPDVSEKEPIASEEESVAPAVETGKAEDSPSEEPSSEELPTEPAVNQSEPDDEGGLEVESEYTFEVGDDLGIGGN
jgi:hypothetical protein